MAACLTLSANNIFKLFRRWAQMHQHTHSELSMFLLKEYLPIWSDPEASSVLQYDIRGDECHAIAL